MDMEDVMIRKMKVSHHPLTCYLDHELFLLEQNRVLDGAGHVAVGPSLDDHRCLQTEQAAGVLGDGFELRRQALSPVASPLSLRLGVPASGAAPELNAFFLKALKGDVRV